MAEGLGEGGTLARMRVEVLHRALLGAWDSERTRACSVSSGIIGSGASAGAR